MLNVHDKITKQDMNRKKVNTGENSSGQNFARKSESRWSELHFGSTPSSSHHQHATSVNQGNKNH